MACHLDGWRRHSGTSYGRRAGHIKKHQVRSSTNTSQSSSKAAQDTVQCGTQAQGSRSTEGGSNTRSGFHTRSDASTAWSEPSNSIRSEQRRKAAPRKPRMSACATHSERTIQLGKHERCDTPPQSTVCRNGLKMRRQRRHTRSEQKMSPQATRPTIRCHHPSLPRSAGG